jgi:threonine aldolase
MLVLSFLPIDFICKTESYGLSKFTLDSSHNYLQLPIMADDIVSSINGMSPIGSGINPRNLPFVTANNIFIEHILGGRYFADNQVQDTDLGKSQTIKSLVQTFHTKPLLQILLVEDNDDWSRTIRNILERYVYDHQLDIDIELLSTIKNGSEVEDALHSNPAIQCVLLDWLLLEPSGQIQSISQNCLVYKIKEIRPEIPIYILTSSENPFDIIQSCGEHFKGYFTKKQFNGEPSVIFNKLVYDFNLRRIAPFWEAYKTYVQESNDSWHTPGHSRGTSFRTSPYLSDFYHFFGTNTFAGDLSVSVEKLGSLLDSTEFIKQAQEKAAKTFGSKRVFFATNGSSTSNKIIIQTMLRPGDGVIVDRNCHKSVHYGVIQAGAEPIYLQSEYSNKYRIFAPPSLDEINEAITLAKKQMGKRIKAIIITGCTYDGMLIDVKQVVSKAHAAGIKVFIDEAWFAYSGFHPSLRRYSAIYSGADYVTHSAHKVLSAFSQASIIHVNDPDFNEAYFKEIFYIYTSTSPQYNMIASLDVATMQMEMEGFQRIEDARKMAERFTKEVISNLAPLKVLSLSDFQKEFPHLVKDNVGHDSLKVLLDISELDHDVDHIHDFLMKEGGLEIEKYTTTTILILFTIGLMFPE